MKVLIDTNILISAALSNTGIPYKAFVKAVSYPNHGIVCEQNIDEMRRIFNRKFQNKIQALESFLSLALLTLEVIAIPEEEYDLEVKIRDMNDHPILRAAISAGADILLTGDRDFIESGILKPRIMMATEFIVEI
nr:putative toxin-antitoxin system toxin component, PIN family [uncultured Catonella sp.]